MPPPFKTNDMKTKILDEGNNYAVITEYGCPIYLTVGDFLEYKGEQWNVSGIILNIDTDCIEILAYNSK